MGAWFKWATAELVVCSMAMAPELIGHVRHIDLRPAYGGNHVPSSTTTLMLFPRPRGPENGIERERLELSAMYPQCGPCMQSTHGWKSSF